MARWTPEEDARLTELAADGLTARELSRALEPRSESAVYGRCSAIGVTLKGGERELRDYLREGGRLVREDLGGVVGVHWAKATRCGESFSACVCDRLRDLGFLAPADGRENVFRWVP